MFCCKGDQLAAGTFDLRGQLDDPTATVSVSGLTETPVEGVVERNGLFWVEGLPLAVGQNSLTLTATDAAGNSAAVNLTLTRSTTAITIDELPEEVLSGAAVDVSGTVSDNTYAEGFEAETGRLRRTTFYPDGGTRIERYYLDGRLFEVLGTAVPDLRYVYDREYDNTVTPAIYATVTWEHRLNASGQTNEWVKTFHDMAGRVYKVMYADDSPEDLSNNPVETRHYNVTTGQLIKRVDPDNLITLYGYNDRGELDTTVLDLDGDSVMDFAGTDRITRRTADCLLAADENNPWQVDIRRSETVVWTANGSDSSMTVAITDISTDGFDRWETVRGDASITVTTHEHTAYARPSRTVTNTWPDLTQTVTAYQYGRVQSVTRLDTNQTQIAQTTYVYDDFGLVNTLSDARNGVTSYTYNNADLVATVTEPAPGTGQSGPVTATYYDTQERPTRIVYPDGGSVTNLYHLTGQLQQVSGSRTYPVGYGYDEQGRLTFMTNWSGFAAGTGARVTTWNYNAYRGWLDNKRYPDSTGPDYFYSLAGRLQTNRLARGNPRLQKAITYNSAGDVFTVGYSDGTPGMTNTYDRRGRLISVFCNGTTTTLTNNDANLLIGESYNGGLLGGLAVTNRYDAWLRRVTNGLTLSGSYLVWSTNAYDAASRPAVVGDDSSTATYSYLANSPLVSQIVFKQGANARMTTTRQYDKLNRLLSISSATNSAPAPLNASAYQYNSANQRTRLVTADGSYWVYQYDQLGQVISGKKYWSDGTPVAGQQFEYGFDDIGNRSSTKAGGDQNGSNLRSATYTPNNLNQYTQRTVPAYVDLLGIANVGASVSVSGDTNVYRRGEYFRKELSVTNSSAAQWVSNSIIATLGTNSVGTTGSIFVAQSPEAFTYDTDGNLKTDGRWTYSWDGENRLTEMLCLTNAPPNSKGWLKFTYDWQGRRILKSAYVWTNSTWSLVLSNKFLYDGWNLIAEVNATNNNVIRSYVWGTDLSGSFTGAGGVGGLLKVTYYGSTTTNAFVAFDGNGNVTALVNAADGTICARYEYGPFGEPIRVSGPMAESNPIRFSTKYTDRESDLLYYGYRYYSPSTSRWLSRDPLEEAGAIALYSYVGNDAVGSFDFLGLKGAGHHIVPWSVFNGLVKEEVQAFFDSDLARIFNDYYKSHGAEKLQGISAKQYNHLVSEELEKFLGKQALREMTLEQAKQFLARITALPSEHPISVYNNAVRRRAAEAMKKALEKAAKRAAERSLKKVLAAGAKRGGAKLTKGIPLVGTVLVVYFYAQDAEAYGAVPAAVNSGIDAIPLVGTGKVIAEFYHRYTFLDVIVGKKNVQPSETDCAE